MAESAMFSVPELLPPFEYHVFITHCDEDLAFAKGILYFLEDKGFVCLFAKRDFLAGRSVVENITESIFKSRKIVMVISKAALHSDWCNFELLVACNDDNMKNRLSIIPLLLDDVNGKELPLPLQYLTWIHVGEEKKFYLQKLMKALAAPNVSWGSKLPAGNVAHGLAWSYYFGYLKLVLPGIKGRIMQSQFWNNLPKNRNMCKKMMFLFPESCRCYNTLTEDDPNIRFEGHLKRIESNRAGTVKRGYSNTVYSIKDKNKKYYFVGEYITAIHTMYEMEESGLAGLPTWYKTKQATYFYLTLMDILKSDTKCCHNCRVIFYKDSISENEHNISKRLLEVIKDEIDSDLAREYSSNKSKVVNIKQNDIDIDGCDSNNDTNDPVLEDIVEDEEQEITNDFYNFLLFDTPEAEPVVVRDEKGMAKTIERGDSITNLLTNS